MGFAAPARRWSQHQARTGKTRHSCAKAFSLLLPVAFSCARNTLKRRNRQADMRDGLLRRCACIIASPYIKFVEAAMSRIVVPCVATLLLVLALAPATAQKTWAPAKTPGGQPDIQGVWTFATITPLERPANLAGKQFFTE